MQPSEKNIISLHFLGMNIFPPKKTNVLNPKSKNLFINLMFFIYNLL